MVLTVALIAKSSVIVTPQSGLAMDVQLKQIAADTLAMLDMAPGTALQFNLTELVAGWNMTEATPQSNSLLALDTEIDKQLNGVIYNIDFAYAENGTLAVKHAIIHGAPVENSVVTTRLVTLYNSTVIQAGGAWNVSSDDLKVVEVRLIAWRV
ncbi:MAG: hypothetical protein O8C66_02965 [Candidatus Methanoperedens sp.]|nr:hypothetical protein [Candidatus Methanoperedens sp.]MCZ7369448.1 hypothetical protein [Candidatus Methanoperedens sp.]